MLLTSPELARLAALAAARRRGAPGAAGGARPGPRLGEGGEFAGHRAYTAGDDPRQIDWAAYARTGGLHIKEFREQVEGALTVCLDLSSSMAAWGKHLTARRVAAAASAVALLSGDRVRVLPCAGGRTLEPASWSDPGDLGDMDRRIEEFPAGGGPGSAAAAKSLLGGRRGRVLLVSDLLEADGPGAALVALREKGHAVAVAHIVAREENSPPAGLLRLRDAESGESREVLVDEPTLEAYRREFEAFSGGWQSRCAAHGMVYTRLSAGAPLSDWAEAVC